MGKNSKTLVASGSVSSPKGKKNNAKKAMNEAAAAERLKKLQARQNLANQIRATTNIVGDDNDVIAEFELLESERDDRAYCDFVLALEWKGLKVGRVVRTFLDQRINRSCADVRYLIELFLSRDGKTDMEGHETRHDNRDCRRAVEEALAAANAKQAA